MVAVCNSSRNAQSNLSESTSTCIVKEYINHRVLNHKNPSVDEWGSFILFNELIPSELFSDLLESFPDKELFEKQEGIKRKHNQNPHDRYYLAYENSIHHEEGYFGKGVAYDHQLPQCWTNFIKNIISDVNYLNAVSNLLETKDFNIRVDWHRDHLGTEVSPHIDAPSKLGSHLFYFNDESIWNDSWGGEFEFLRGKKLNKMNPSFDDFANSNKVSIKGNVSLLFKNGPNSWHGVRKLSCPESSHRKLLCLIFEDPKVEDNLLTRGNFI